MFSLPQKVGMQVEGSNDECPIHLEQVSAVDFERLLSLFYPQNINGGDLKSVEEWTSILALATKFEFEGFRELAIARLVQLATPVDRILLARKYDVNGWLVPAYIELCRREISLTLDEGERLGMKDVIVLSDIRQYMRGGGSMRVTHTDRVIQSLLVGKLV